MGDIATRTQLRNPIDLATIAWTVWIVLLIAIVAHAAVYPWSHTVYNIYGPASRQWWSGEDLYAPVIKEWYEGPGNRVTTTDYYRYSPTFAIAISPLAFLPDTLGNPLWKSVNAVVFLAGLWAAARHLLLIGFSRMTSAWLFLLVLPVSLTSLYIGQANLLVIGVMLLALAAAVDDRWSIAAICLTAATLIKGYPLALAMLLAVLYPRQFSVRFIGTMTIGLVVPFLTQPPGVVAMQYAHWWHHLSDSTTLMRERLRSVDQLFAISGHPLSSHAYLLLEIATGAGVLGLCLLHARQTGNARERLTWLMMLFSTWVALFGPATEACTYAIIGPALAWSLIDAFRRPTPWIGRLVLMVCLILMGPAVTDLFGSTVRVLAHQYGSQAVGGLIYLAYLLTKNAREAMQGHAAVTIKASSPAPPRWAS